ncbi:TraB/TrbI/VirB10 family type IV secretion system protein [Novosphingobium gossypii]|uniref:TrbI/VirB10 family protein n=1 Tax=Novosphingobium gossypii TaxID=1604774 RepID=UPI003D1B5F3D
MTETAHQGNRKLQDPAPTGGTPGPSENLEHRQDAAFELRGGDAADRDIAKLDPETLAIRARPPRAIRFRREVIITASAVSIIAIAAVGWFALRPQLLRTARSESELSAPSLSQSSQTLDALPRSYDEVPKLGAPLPGDLGRPILKAQERGNMMSPTSTGPSAEANAAQALAERRAAEMTAARQSALIATSASATPAVSASVVGIPSPDEPGGETVGARTDASPTATDRNVQFAEQRDSSPAINPHAISASASPYMLTAGSVIVASLVTGLNSDLPGMVVAQVSQNVYDSATGQILLIPQGARLIGKYDSAVSYGQSRALVVWQRLLMPDGSSLQLDNMPATDAAGRAGLSDEVDYHTGRLVKGVALSTLLGVGTELSISGEGGLVRAFRDSAQTNTARAGDQITQRNLDVQPTIVIRAGASVRLIVRQDLVLNPWKQEN